MTTTPKLWLRSTLGSKRTSRFVVGVLEESSVAWPGLHMADDSEEDELDVGGGADKSSGLTHKQREERRLAAFCWLDRPMPPGYSSVLVKVGSNDATALSLDESKHTVVERIEGESLVKHFFGVKQFTQIRTDATLADWRDPYDTTDGAAYTLSFTDLPNAPELYSEPKRMYQSYLDRPFKAVAKLPAAGSPKRVRAEWMSLLCKAKITVVRASFDNFARCDFETVPEFLADGAADERAIDILRTTTGAFESRVFRSRRLSATLTSARPSTPMMTSPA